MMRWLTVTLLVTLCAISMVRCDKTGDRMTSNEDRKSTNDDRMSEIVMDELPAEEDEDRSIDEEEKDRMISGEEEDQIDEDRTSVNEEEDHMDSQEEDRMSPDDGIDRAEQEDRHYHNKKYGHNNKRIIIRKQPYYDGKRYYEYNPRFHHNRQHYKRKGRYYYRDDEAERSDDVDQSRSETVEEPAEPTEAELNLARMAGAVESTEMNIKQSRMEEAVETAEDAEKYTQEAVEADAIAPEKAVAIQKSVEVVKVAAKSGDQEAALESVQQLQDRVDEVMVSQKGEEVAENLKYAEENQDKPVLSTPEDEETLEAVVDELIDADEFVPEEDKEEAKQYTVEMMKEGLKEAETTNGEVIAEVEENAPAVQAEESMDRSYYSGHRKYGRRRHYRPRYYHPYYHPYYPRYSYYPYKRYHRGYGRRYHHHGRRHYKKHHGKSYYRDDDNDNEEDRSDEAEDRASYSSGRRSYYPYYYKGYGFRQCLYYNSYRYCARRLMKDYAYQRGYHHSYHRPRYYYQYSKY